MKYANVVATGSLLLSLTGCVSAHKLTVQDTLGPCHRVPSASTAEGSLQVYSGRERSLADINREVYFWNQDYARNEFLYGANHTDYTIYAGDGAVYRRVHNDASQGGDSPALIPLPRGTYTIEAEAEAGGGVALTVVVPLVIEPGQKTTIHLEPGWKPLDEAMDPSRMVQLADGRIIGCRAAHLVSQNP